MLRLLSACISVVVVALAALPSSADEIDPNRWGPDTRVTQDSQDSYPYAMLDLADGSLGLIWANIIQHQADAEILFSSGSVSGSWSSPVVIAPAGSDKSWGWEPAATGANGRLHLAYSDTQPGNWEVFHVYSDDNGATWSVPTRLTNAPNYSWNCAVKTFGDNVYSIWNDNRSGSMWASRDAIYIRSSHDNGITWNPEVKISDGTTSYAWAPRLIVDPNGTLHAVWQDSRDGAEELYYDYSTDSGATWHQDTAINADDDTTSDRACWVLDQEGNIHLFWVDRLMADDPGLYYRRSKGDISGGVGEWSERQRLGNYQPPVQQELSYQQDTVYRASSYLYEHGVPQCAMVDGVIHVAWTNYLTRVTPGGEVGEAWIQWLYSTDGGETWSQPVTISHVNSMSTQLFCIPSRGRLILVWSDDRDGNMEVYAKRFPDEGGDCIDANDTRNAYPVPEGGSAGETFPAWPNPSGEPDGFLDFVSLEANWYLRDSQGVLKGPGPQVWSEQNITIGNNDVEAADQKALCLHVDGKDTYSVGAEVCSIDLLGNQYAMGYGRYKWRMRTEGDPGYVAALFLYPDTSTGEAIDKYKYTEIDFEYLSRLEGCDAGNLLLTCWQESEDVKDGEVVKRHQITWVDARQYHDYEIDWKRNEVIFRIDGNDVGDPVRDFVPWEKATVRMNIWSGGWAGVLEDGAKGEMWIDSFSYTPAE